MKVAELRVRVTPPVGTLLGRSGKILRPQAQRERLDVAAARGLGAMFARARGGREHDGVARYIKFSQSTELQS